MATYLDDILSAHRAAAAADGRDVSALRAAALSHPEPVRGFAAALREASGPSMAVIAEVKRRSPSRGALAPGLDPAAMSRAYEAGGATCLSVLTDHDHFGGSAEDLASARDACRLPVLRKDFTVRAADIYDARIMGADAVLLIVAALTESELAVLAALAAEVGLDALVECHDEAEVERAVAVGATVIGVNQRDLTTFEVDTNRAERVAAAIPETALAIAESGIRGAADAERLAAAGYDAVLVGEGAVTAADPAAAVAALRVPVGVPG